MKADTSRSTFDPAKHFRQVFRQQGRVDLDADWNEQQDIHDHLRTATTAHLVGPAGGPAAAAAFALTTHGTGLSVSNGRYYVDGVLVECDGPSSGTDVWAQQDLPPNAPIIRLKDGNDVPGPTPPPGRYLVYLHVWDLHRTALEEEAVREVALGGPDSTTRVKTVWQVKLLQLGNLTDPVDCTVDTPEWQALTAASTGRLEARAEPAEETGGDPCIVPAGAGFRGVENQHYRVEIHRGGDAGEATFIWARDNASTAVTWVSGPDLKGAITVAGPGRDAVLGFTSGMWVELTDDKRELLGGPGKLVRLKEVIGNRLTLEDPTGIDIADFPLGPRVRRWEAAEQPVVRPATGDGWVALESGVQVRFAAARYRTGDHWLIPARTHLADILWPRGSDGTTPLPQEPKGIRHRFAKLAVVSFDGTQWKDPHDCRELFPDLTQLVTLRAVSGDGQTVLPLAVSTPTLVELPEPIVVGVSNGALPVPGARVRFVARPGEGRVAGVGDKAVVTTDDQGQATVSWELRLGVDTQTLRAELLDAADRPTGLPAVFNASLLTAERTSYTPNNSCPDLAAAATVQQAIDTLCRRPTGLPKQQGVHVTNVAGGGFDILHNNATVALGSLSQKIVVDVDQSLDPDTVSRATCAVTVELPYPLTAQDQAAWGAEPAVKAAGFQTFTVEAAIATESSDTVITWQPTDMASIFLKKVLKRMRDLNMDPKVLARLVLKGSFIMSADRRLHLDGDTFLGAEAGSLDIHLPSGDDRRGGTFELWFWIKEG
ncbi:DUF6519 domain-containing protein [Streptomyces triculaminicus]|uniref:DUF6519 domain-containing protein n=1 Tax=Streptomyces triculaminicus TaxID=2816232 RepID=UPI0037D758B5